MEPNDAKSRGSCSVAEILNDLMAASLQQNIFATAVPQNCNPCSRFIALAYQRQQIVNFFRDRGTMKI